MCGINAYLTRTEYDEMQVVSIVDFLISDIDNDENSEIDIIEFYNYYKRSKNSEEFFQMLYGKGIENKINSSGNKNNQTQRTNRTMLVEIYKKLMTYMHYYKNYLMGPEREGEVYPLLHEQ